MLSLTHIKEGHRLQNTEMYMISFTCKPAGSYILTTKERRESLIVVHQNFCSLHDRNKRILVNTHTLVVLTCPSPWIFVSLVQRWDLQGIKDNIIFLLDRSKAKSNFSY